MVRARFPAIGAGVCLQPPRGDLVTVWGTLGRARWRDRTRQEALADWAGASLRGRWVGRMAGQWRTGAVRLGVEWLAAVPRRD